MHINFQVVVKKERSDKKFTLNIWCMNPAVCFSSLSDQCKSIILTSSTLSPMTSFASELGADFPFQCEAPHVVSMTFSFFNNHPILIFLFYSEPEQTWVSYITRGPQNGVLSSIYTNSKTTLFQDELGRVCIFLAFFKSKHIYFRQYTS